MRENCTSSLSGGRRQARRQLSAPPPTRHRGNRVTPVEGRDLSSRQTQNVAKDMEIGKPINSKRCSEAADGVARERPREVLSESRMREICTSGCVSSEGWRVQQEKGLPGQKSEPRSLDSRVAGNQDSEAYRQRLPWGDDESPGRNNSERKSGLESE